MKEQAALSVFATLSNETRLKMLRQLVSAGPSGLSAGEIAQRAGASPSRASFHLKAMAEAGLVASERKAREIRYCVRFATLGALVTFLMEDCCAGSPELRACCPPD